MGVFLSRSSATEKRDAFPYPEIPPNSMSPLSMRRVDLSKAETGMQSVAVWASVNVLASMMETVPLNTFTGYGDDRRQIAMPRWLADLGGQGHGLKDFAWQTMYCWGLRGNVIGKVLERDNTTGKPRTIDLVHPDKVHLSGVDGPGVSWYINGAHADAEDIWHRRVYPVPGSTMGLSPIAQHATTIGTGLAALNFGAQWFLDGAHPSGIMTNELLDEITDTQAVTMKARFIAAIRGTREPAVLSKGWKYQQIQISPNESQFLETQEYTAAQAARIYGPGMPELLGYKVGNSMTYANIEQRAIDLLTFSVDPWFARFERAITDLLPAPQSVEFDREELMRTDTKTRYEAFQIALKNGFKVINDVRRKIGDPPVEWGDEPYLPALGGKPEEEEKPEQEPVVPPPAEP